MKQATTAAIFAAALTAVPSSVLAQGSVLQPGISIFPFAGSEAGGPALAGPRFGLIDAPGGRHGGFMYISEQAGGDLVRIDAGGRITLYTGPFGLFPSGAHGLDLDGPTANSPAPTMGLFGGPAAMFVGQGPVVTIEPPLIRVLPGGVWGAWRPLIANPGHAQVQIDRTPGFRYGGAMFVSDWGGDASDAILMVGAAGPSSVLAAIPNTDPRYFTFDVTGPASGFGPPGLWVSSYSTGTVFSITPLGVVNPPIAVLRPGVAGLAFGPGDAYFGAGLFACNLNLGEVDIIMPDGTVKPFARGLPGAAYPMFVTAGPYARYGNPTLYIADGVGSVWMFTHCPADLNDDGLVDFSDYLMFLNLYDAGDPKVDYTADGLVDFSDYLEFLNFYAAGC